MSELLMKAQTTFLRALHVSSFLQNLRPLYIVVSTAPVHLISTNSSPTGIVFTKVERAWIQTLSTFS